MRYSFGDPNTCWTCCGEGVIITRDYFGRERVTKCPACRQREMIREYKERERQRQEEAERCK